jgi:ribosomal protein S18 acetylase RimI-like enzyme
VTIDDVLDNPVWHALTGSQAVFAERVGRAARYLPEVSVFSALEDPADEHCWSDGAELVGPGGILVLTDATDVPEGWERAFTIPCLQMVATTLQPEPDPEATVLGPADVPDMADLIARTDPGPFRDRTPELGTYLGIRRGGALAAMAGERIRPAGWAEVSAVCTDPAYRGQGLAARLVRAVAAGVVERGDTPFLHVATENTNAIRLYEKLGFTERRSLDVIGFKLSSSS